MSAILDLLNKNSGAINLLFALVVAGATVFYAVLTNRLVSETKRMREVQTEPALAISIDPSEHGLNFINLVIANTGAGPARDVRLSAAPDFMRFQGQRISELGIFKYGIKHLAPGQNITVFLTSLLDAVHGGSQDLGRLNFSITASFRSPSGRGVQEVFPIHFDSFEGYGSIGTPPLLMIARSLERVQQDIGHAVSGFKHLEVNVSTREDLRQDNERMRERFSHAAPQAEKGSDDQSSPA